MDHIAGETPSGTRPHDASDGLCVKQHSSREKIRSGTVGSAPSAATHPVGGKPSREETRVQAAAVIRTPLRRCPLVSHQVTSSNVSLRFERSASSSRTRTLSPTSNLLPRAA